MKFTKTHEWVDNADEIATVGISEFAQREVGDIVYVELPTVGHQLKAGDEAVVIESTKAAVDIYSPLTGEIIAVNTALKDAPEKINQSPESEGWLFKIRLEDPSELHGLLDKAHYSAYISEKE